MATLLQTNLISQKRKKFGTLNHLITLPCVFQETYGKSVAASFKLNYYMHFRNHEQSNTQTLSIVANQIKYGVI